MPLELRFDVPGLRVGERGQETAHLPADDPMGDDVPDSIGEQQRRERQDEEPGQDLAAQAAAEQEWARRFPR